MLAGSVGEGPALIVVGEVVARSNPWREAELKQLFDHMRDAA
jgi:siroheme synthase